jgi:hypothetical protein
MIPYHQGRIRASSDLPFVRFIRPDMTHSGWLTVSEAQARTLEAMAYDEAIEALADAEVPPSPAARPRSMKRRGLA